MYRRKRIVACTAIAVAATVLGACGSSSTSSTTTTSNSPTRGLVAFPHESSSCQHAPPVAEGNGLTRFTWENYPTDTNYYLTAYWHVNENGVVKRVDAVNAMKMASVSGSLTRNTPVDANEWYWSVSKGSDPTHSSLDAHGISICAHR
jgi:hypothetical protein